MSLATVSGDASMKASRGRSLHKPPPSEKHVLTELRQGLALSPAQRRAISEDASELITALRAKDARPGVFEQLLRHFSLSTEEGLALMGLAEALLRVPDEATALDLVNERLAQGDWAASAAASNAFWPRLAARGLGLG